MLKFVLFMYCSFADLQKPQHELDGKACAGVGQSSLMAYYETMFDQVILYFKKTMVLFSRLLLCRVPNIDAFFFFLWVAGCDGCSAAGERQ